MPTAAAQDLYLQLKISEFCERCCVWKISDRHLDDLHSTNLLVSRAEISMYEERMKKKRNTGMVCASGRSVRAPPCAIADDRRSGRPAGTGRGQVQEQDAAAAVRRALAAWCQGPSHI